MISLSEMRANMHLQERSRESHSFLLWFIVHQKDMGIEGDNSPGLQGLFRVCFSF